MKRRRTIIVVGILIFACVVVAVISPDRPADTTEAVGQVVATDVPVATATPSATDTPAPTSTAAPPPATLTPGEVVCQLAAGALSAGNRDVPRVAECEFTGDRQAYVKWAINDSVSTEWIRGGAQIDVVAMLRALDGAGLDYDTVRLVGTFIMGDVYGNESEEPVVTLIYQRATVDKINWGNFDRANVFDVADTAKIHPELQAP